MKRRDFVISTFAYGIGFSIAPSVIAQTKTIEADLVKLAEGKGLKVFNRSVSRLDDAAKKGVRLSENQAMGVVYLEGIEFSNGAIECDLRGKDVQGQSFVGVVFHGLDGNTYDAIYFRPFNFRAQDSDSVAERARSRGGQGDQRPVERSKTVRWSRRFQEIEKLCA